jgi:hypothetical protein
VENGDNFTNMQPALPRRRRAVAAAAMAKAMDTALSADPAPLPRHAMPMSGGPAMAVASPQTPRQRAGQKAEQRARTILEQAGLVFIAANVRYKLGEIDLVMREGPIIVFVEVRARASLGWGGAAGSIDGRKQQRIIRAAQLWMQAHCGSHGWPPCRFDVVAFEAGRMNWIQQAF